MDIDKALEGFVMTAEDMMDTSLVGCDQGEFATVHARHLHPSLSQRDPARDPLRRSSAASRSIARDYPTGA